MSYLVESTPVASPPYAADIVNGPSRVMVYPVTLRTTYAHGVPILTDVVYVTACGIVDRCDPIDIRARQTRRR